MSGTDVRECVRCGRSPATWLVLGAVRSNAPGRVLTYCDHCREEGAQSLGLALPLHVFDRDPQSILFHLYETGATRTMPDAVADQLGVPRGPWFDLALALIGTPEEKAAAQTPADVAAPFAASIHAKALLLASGRYTARQTQKIVESAAGDLRKCSDVLAPDPIPYLISERAAEAAAALSVDLKSVGWHAQTRFDPGRVTFHYEHYYPVMPLARECLRTSSFHEVEALLLERVRVAWITKDENTRLTVLGFTSRRPDPPAAYAAAGIRLVGAARP